MADKGAKNEPVSYVTQQEFRTLSDSVSRISGSFSTWKWLSALATTAVIGAVTWSVHIGNKVTAIEQSLSDSGVKLVAELKSPQSPEQLQTNLIKVTAQIETAKVEGKLPDQSKVLSLSNVLSGIVKSNPDMPSAWNAAMQLVNYRFESSAKDISSLPDCLNLPLTGVRPEAQGPSGPDGIPTHHPFNGPPIARKWEGMVAAQNCRLDLDDNGNFASSQAEKDFDDAKRHNSGINYYILEVTNAYITYKGGKLLPINEIRFKNCSFQIEPSFDVPDKRRQSITQQLLEAKNNEGAIQLPIGM
jgi:hypothetical protein